MLVSFEQAARAVRLAERRRRLVLARIVSLHHIAIGPAVVLLRHFADGDFGPPGRRGLAKEEELGLGRRLHAVSRQRQRLDAGGDTRCGGMMITSSDWVRWKSALRKSAPSTGTSPSQGIWPFESVKSSCSRPAMAKLSPSRISTVVCASRRLKAFRVMPVPTLVWIVVSMLDTA